MPASPEESDIIRILQTGISKETPSHHKGFSSNNNGVLCKIHSLVYSAFHSLMFVFKGISANFGPITVPGHGFTEITDRAMGKSVVKATAIMEKIQRALFLYSLHCSQQP